MAIVTTRLGNDNHEERGDHAEMPTEREFYSVRELARKLGLSPKSIYRLRKRPHDPLPYLQPTHKFLIPAPAFKEWLARQR